MLFMAISLSFKHNLFLHILQRSQKHLSFFWSGAEEKYLPDLLLTILSYSDDTNPSSTADKELVTTFLLPQQSANLLPKYTFTFSWKHFLYMKSSIKIKTQVPKIITTNDQIEIDLLLREIRCKNFPKEKSVLYFSI